ncbi:MAG: sigma-70 family RNA polymerase sigma factor [Planctomycetota bacterium]|nr:sigma-70 family RNA polymerase sigma factor [Planctomycetota bacterium]
MPDPQLSRLFERYRAHNDLAALAEVFDRVSPDLLRVARHVGGRDVEPEDLMQATFLAAIERSATFDAERPLLPWLLGILVNQSRRTHRYQSKLLSEDSESAIPARPDHENDAESHEIDTAVTRALAELPEHYREVLVPHLSEGKDPHVIARELGRPQGTVRAQIHRGIRLLRRLLPTGYALGGFSAVQNDALDVVRERVLAAGAQRIGRGPEALAESAARKAARVLRRRATTVGAASLLGVALWLAWPTPIADLETADIASPRTSMDEPRAAAELTAPTPPESRVAPVGATEQAESAAKAETFGSVLVRVREADSASPTAGARVKLLTWGNPRWFEHVRETRTDAQGLAHFERVNVGRVAVHLEGGEQIRNEVFADRETAIHLARPRPIALEVVVTGTDGRAIAGAILDVHAARDEPSILTSAPTDAFGRVRIDRAPDECFVSARADGHVKSTLSWSGRHPAADATARFTIELERGGFALEGVVIDEHGAPIDAANVIVSSDEPAPFPIWRADGMPSFESAPSTVQTGVDGRFRVDGLRDRAVRLRVAAPGRGVHVARIVRDAATFGFETVRLAQGATVRGTTSFADGSPVQTAHIEVFVEGRAVDETRSALDGSFVVDELPARGVTLRARAGAYGPITALAITLNAGEKREWNPTLVGGETIEGRAIGQDRRPISTWLVLATPEDSSIDATQRLAHWSREQVPAPVDDLALQNWISPSGIFVVPCRSDATHRIELRARAAWREPPQAFVAGARPGARDVVLRVVQARGRIQGRFVDEDGRVVAMSRVIAVANGSTGELIGTIDSTSGRFEVETLAGAHDLLAWSSNGTLHHLGTIEVTRPAAVDMGDVVVRAAGDVEVTVAHTDLRGLALIGASGLRFELTSLGEHVWRARNLQPGVYVLQARFEDDQVLEERADVRSGAVTRFTFGDK